MNYKATKNDYFDDLVPHKKAAVKKSSPKGCPGNKGGQHVYFVTRVDYYNTMTDHTWHTCTSFCIGCEKKQKNFNRNCVPDDRRFFMITGRDSQRFAYLGMYINERKFNTLMEKKNG